MASRGCPSHCSSGPLPRGATSRGRAGPREMFPSQEIAADFSQDLRHTIRAELDRLPDTYREPVTLCYLQGLTHQEAAQQLGWPLGTVKVRLVRGRRLLRERLDRRGVGLGAALLFFLLDPGKARAVPLPLVDSTARAMALVAAGRRSALVAEFGAAHALADVSTVPRSTAFQFKWLFAAMVAAVVTLGLSGPAVRAFQRPLSNGIDPASLPANLTDVLRVDCD